jgi:uncharacterized protein YyaL (SSP411 family)
MERESFDDPATARLLNEGFVCVKVDREERPDVDTIYMRAVQSLTGRGGWPLTVFLASDGSPFYGGTYFPPEPRHGLPSFRQVLEAVRSAWDERREEVRGAADRIRGVLERANLGGAEDSAPRREVSEAQLAGATRTLLRHVDEVHGGFGGAPKFPQPVVLSFLLERAALAEDEEALEAVLLTLDRMAKGGIRDHLGGGFHRYTVDARWLVPHFEKMLYDNALLARAYLQAFQLTGRADLERVCRETLEDLLGDFRSPEGGFFSARDADSEGEEGRYYVWTPAEVEAVLGPDEARLFCRVYDVTERGNFEGSSILHLPHDPDAIARSEGLSPDAIEERLGRSRRALAAARAARVPPLRDEKILASWNGLVLRTLAEAGAALAEPRYVEAAREGTRWLFEILRPEGRTLHQITAGQAKIPGFLDDVASLGNTALSVYEATLDPWFLAAAEELDREVEARFRDAGTDLLHDAPADGEPLIIRPREITDSPMPSGTSLAAELRLRLGRLFGDQGRVDAATAIVARESPLFEAMPSALGNFLAVAGRLAARPVEVVILGEEGDPARAALLREAHQVFLPGRTVAGGDLGVLPASPLFEGRGLVGGRATAYLCHAYTCERPTSDPLELARQLRGG